MSYYCNDPRLVPNKRHSIVEKDENGFIIGAYTGYWNPDWKSVALYPDWRHPAVKPGMKLVKRRVYDGLVKCKKLILHPPQAVPLPQRGTQGQNLRRRGL